MRTLEIYRDADLLVRGVFFDGPTCFVTFDSYTDERTLDRAGFAEAHFKNRTISAIHFIQRDNEWWQYPAMPRALTAARAETAKFQRVVTYGASLGGYGALRFADAVGAHAAFAVAPQYSIDRAKAPFETRWGQEARRIQFRPDLEGPITCAAAAIAAYDPFSSDVEHIRLIQADIALSAIRLAHAGHSVLACLHECDELPGVLARLAVGEIDCHAVERSLHGKRRNSATWMASFAESLPPRRRFTALAIARRAVDADADSLLALSVLAHLLEEAGDFDQAIAVYERAAAVSKRSSPYLHNLSRALFHAGRIPEALEVAKEGLAAAPLHALNHHWVAHIHYHQNQFDHALPYSREAVALDPAEAPYRQTLMLIEARATPLA